jgi:hypothetical protein
VECHRERELHPRKNDGVESFEHRCDIRYRRTDILLARAQGSAIRAEFSVLLISLARKRIGQAGVAAYVSRRRSA